MRLLFVRHGQTDNNALGLIQGRGNPPLNVVGLAQAESLVKSLENESFSRVISSPLLRARQTAEVIASAYDVPLELDDRLMERDFGTLQDQPYQALLVHPVTGEPDFFRDAYQEYQAEPICDMMSRVTAFLDDVATSDEESILVVAHGGIGYLFDQLLAASDAPLVADNGRVQHYQLTTKKE